MFNKKNKRIIANTMNLARGTYLLSILPNDEFTTLYKAMEAKKVENPSEYKIPDWFTIQFVDGNKKDVYIFLGSFHEGKKYPIVYKELFIEEMKRYKINFKELKDNKYKIKRNPIQK